MERRVFGFFCFDLGLVSVWVGGKDLGAVVRVLGGLVVRGGRVGILYLFLIEV